MGGRTVIAGIGHTAYGKLPGRSTVSLNVEACREALRDAAVEKDRVDGVFVKYPTSRLEFLYATKVAEALGLQPAVCGVWDQGGATNISLVWLAAMAIESGQCEIALVTAADNPRTGTRQAYHKAWDDDAVYGWFGLPAGYAMIARRHMIEHGTTSEQLGAIAVACRTHAARNPDAQLRERPITVADHQRSPLVVDPLRRDDCCLVSDAGAAVVVMSERRATALGVPDPVAVLGVGQGQTAWDVAQRPTLTETAARGSGRRAFGMAGVRPRDIDVAQLYDCFTITPLVTLEDYGFCPRGHGGRFVELEGIGLDGSLPLNTSGGLLAETGMPGMQLVMEGVRQVRGTSTTQVRGARTCLVSGQGGVMHTHATLILGR